MAKDDEEIRDAQIYYNIIKDRYNFSWENKILLDEKGSKNIVSIGILLTLYSAMVSISLITLPKEISFSQYVGDHCIVILIFVLELVILLASFLNAAYAYSKLDKWEVVPFRPNIFIEKYASNKDVNIILALGSLSKSMADAVEKNDVVSERRTNYITLSFYFLVIGLIGILICFISWMFILI